MPARPDWGLGDSAKDLLRNFVNNLNTHDMANRVIANAKLDMNSYDLLAKITVSAEPENFIIRVDAKDQDPEIAKKIVTTMAGEFVDERVAYYNTQDKANRIEVKLVDSVIRRAALQAQAGHERVGRFCPGCADRRVDRAGVGVDGRGRSWRRRRPSNARWACRFWGPFRRLWGRTQRYAEAQMTQGKNMTANLVTLTNPSSPAAEAYRRLRVNLTSAGREAALHTLLVAAAGADADKAATVANAGRDVRQGRQACGAGRL